MNWVNPSSDSTSKKDKLLASSNQSGSDKRAEGTEKLVKNDHIELSENSKTILERRYLTKNTDGSPSETVEGLFERVARVVAEPDAPYTDVKTTEIEFYNLLTKKKFFPNSPTFTGAGTPLGQLAGCFVLPVGDDIGREYDGIFSTLRVAALIQQLGGGNGFSFSRLRPRGSAVRSSNGVSTGPVGFMAVYDNAFGEIAQGGIRRGANMGVLRVDHPDIREFITCKSTEGNVENFNISVAITDKFMKAVKEDSSFELIDPNTKEVNETPQAREIFDLIVENSFKNGEPGVLFIDQANRSNPVPHLYELEATNPCGEQWLGPYENCCLGSINLGQHMDDNGNLDWEALRLSTQMSTRFLDNVVTANKYVPEIPEVREAGLNARRIGLGIMGLADAMYSEGIRYGSSEGQEYAAQIMEFIRFHSMKTSVELAKERGPFLKIKGSIYDPHNMIWQPPKPLKNFSRDFNRPEFDWNEVIDGIKEYGIRNAAQTTVAPTGTISTVAGVEGYGCEPVFALAYLRNVYQASGGDENLTLTYVSPAFEQALEKLDLDGPTKKGIIEEVIKTGTCQNVDGLPEYVKRVFVVSSDVTADEHIMMQASIQAFVDNSISKTCNFPENATREDVAKAYIMGWELGCKGLTVYVTGSRQEVVLETHETKGKKDGVLEAAVSTTTEDTRRSYKLSGNTYKIETPQGIAYITINKDEEGNPLELFINVGKAGTDVAALAEGLGRMLSGWLRATTDHEKTLKKMVAQLVGIGGRTSVGFGEKRVSSIPDAVSKVLAEEFGITVKQNGSNIVEDKSNEIFAAAHVDMCPDCGNASLVQEEGCAKCHECGYSQC